MKHLSGFTVIELIVVTLFALMATGLLLYQKNNVEASRRDENRKTAINAMYYNLEEVFFKTNGFYPEKINSSLLTAMDPELFKDPSGNSLGEQNSDYRYAAIDCENEQCSGYRLSTTLEKEADYIKTNT